MSAGVEQRIIAALDEAERLADQAGNDGEWFLATDAYDLPNVWVPQVGHPEEPRSMLWPADLPGWKDARGSTIEHIAAWAPHRVLALITADRNLLGYATELAQSGVPAAAVIAGGLVKYLAARWEVQP